jgi:hypothetical protein
LPVEAFAPQMALGAISHGSDSDLRGALERAQNGGAGARGFGERRAKPHANPARKRAARRSPASRLTATTRLSGIRIEHSAVACSLLSSRREAPDRTGGSTAMNGTMTDNLVLQLSAVIDQYSAEQHELARRLGALRRARTELRLGRSPAVVSPLLEDELGEPLETLIGRPQGADRPPARSVARSAHLSHAGDTSGHAG